MAKAGSFVPVLALIIACLAFVQAEPEPAKERTYLFGAWPLAGNMMYDEKTGDINGFFIDLVQAVCKRAGKKCEMYLMNSGATCWDNALQYSLGLWHNWFDACLGFLPIKERMRTNSFFGEFKAYNSKSTLYAANPNTQLKPKDSKIGFRRFVIMSPGCLRLQGIIPGEVVLFETSQEIVTAVKNGDIDFGFSSESSVNTTEGIYPYGDPIKCYEGRLSLMTRKENIHQFAWYDEALDEMKEDGEYKDICRKGELMYNVATNCLGD